MLYCGPAFAGLPPQVARPPVRARKCIAIVSGLAAGEPGVDAPRLMLLLDWMKGMLGDTATCQSVARLVICGARSPALCSFCFVAALPSCFRTLRDVLLLCERLSLNRVCRASSCALVRAGFRGGAAAWSWCLVMDCYQGRRRRKLS